MTPAFHPMTTGRTLRTVALWICLAAPVAARAEHGHIEFQAYGELLYSMYNFGPDQKSSPGGAPRDYRAALDLTRVSGELGYEFTPTLEVEVEVEVEHGGVGLARELEYEEFGEYETEIEKGGEVTIEEFSLTKTLSEHFEVSVGHLMVPIGLLNTRHRPAHYFGTVRPEGETTLLPNLWHENGLQLSGRYESLLYTGQVVNGLDASGFSSKEWIAGGYQAAFETARATDLATVVRVDYEFRSGILSGGSLYYGNSTRNRPKQDMEGISGHVTIADLHTTINQGAWAGSALALFGALENADLISAKNARLSTNGDFPRTPVAKNALLWSVELGHDIAPYLTRSTKVQLYPFARLEYYNSMERTDPGIFASPRFERRLITGGVNLDLDRHVVLKADCALRSFGDNRYRDETTYRLSFAFQTEPTNR